MVTHDFFITDNDHPSQRILPARKAALNPTHIFHDLSRGISPCFFTVHLNDQHTISDIFQEFIERLLAVP